MTEGPTNQSERWDDDRDQLRKSIEEALRKSKEADDLIKKFIKQYDQSTPEQQRALKQDPETVARVDELFEQAVSNARHAQTLIERYERQNEIERMRLANINAKFQALPETARPMHFSVGEKVGFPLSEESKQLTEWEIVRAEKGHYLLERQSEGGISRAFFSEEEVLKHNRG
jgi:hypothetical protein